jgi:hypothetical protein
LLRFEKPSYQFTCYVQLGGRHAVWTHAATLAHQAIQCLGRRSPQLFVVNSKVARAVAAPEEGIGS